ncbi:DNA replication and repair protein RecO [Lachnospiraceae bacterium]|nr:DNA replication and repair protein RecO [Lachnospiraceae bacterium]
MIQDFTEVHGIILKSADYSEYDRRLTILTSERGKITVFAHGVRKTGNRFMAATEPFTFGLFRLKEGRSAYNLRDAEINNYFEGIRMDLEAFYLGSYFLEVASYYARENDDGMALLKLVYAGLTALLKENSDKRLIRHTFEVKAIQINGEFPGLPNNRTLLPGTVHAISFIMETPPLKVFSFQVNDEVLREFILLVREYTHHFLNVRFKSLEIMKEIGL